MQYYALIDVYCRALLFKVCKTRERNFRKIKQEIVAAVDE